MSKIKLLLFVTVFIVSAFFIYKYAATDNEINKNSLKISSDSLLPPNTEYLKDVRVSTDGNMAFEVPLSEIMGREQKYGPLSSLRVPKKSGEKEGPDRENLPQNPNSEEVSQYPGQSKNSQNNESGQTDAPQTVGVNFNGANLTGTNPTGSFPPDDMGEVGPTQYIVHVNGRIVSYLKSTGAADAIINTTPDNFFASVMSSGSYTSDPRIRYDRLTKKWYFLIIDVTPSNIANRVLIGVSPDSTIKASTVFKFFFYQNSGSFWDYPTLGVDVNALYIGGNLFTLVPPPSNPTFLNTTAIVIRKSSIQSTGPMVATSMGNLLVSNAGPFTPQGVDNPDPSATEGYFIGVDNATFGTLMIRRISTPGGTPTISSNISLTVPSTSFPLSVNHPGNTGGTAGRLDALDDRLFMAQMRNGSLWTTHNIGVNSSGTTSSATRNGSRWYQIGNLTTTPTLTQSGTVFDNTTNAGSYWIPTIATSGQGHSAMIYSIAGASTRINMGSVGRFSSDAAGTMQTPLTISNNTTFAYNPSDPSAPKRWGDYSCIRVDPNDDMTFWGIAQWCSGNNNYGCYVAQLKAPPPATPTSTSPSSIPIGSSVAVTLTGTSSSGSGFFDPGIGFANHIGVAIDGGVVVNSVTYVNPTTLNLNVNTTGAVFNSTRTVTVTNPDGQTSAATMFVVLPVELASFTSSVNKNDVSLKWTTITEENNAGFDIERKSANDNSWSKVGFVSGCGNSNSQINYEYPDKKLQAGKYNYRLKQVDYNGNFRYYDLMSEVEVGIPAKFTLLQNYPNPFNPSTKIDFELPENAKVTIKIFDISGKQVAEILNKQMTAGYYSNNFNASSISSGVYFYTMHATSETGRNFNAVKKMILTK